MKLTNKSKPFGGYLPSGDSQLWDALVTHRPRLHAPLLAQYPMKPATAAALIEYGQGDKTKFNEIRALLKT